MNDPLQRLYRTKLTLLATILTIVGLALLIFAKWAEGRPELHWVGTFPTADLGSALFTTGLIAIAFSYVDGNDSELRATQQLREVLRTEAPAIRDAVIDGFAFEPEDLARVANPETLDQVITNGLALRLGDKDFASEVYGDIREQAVRAAERWHDARISVALSMERGTPKRRAPLFVTTVEVEYTTIPKHVARRFAAVSDRDQYRDLAQDPESTTAWYLSPAMGLEADDPDAFALVAFSVDGEPRAISRTARKGSQVYSATIGKQAVDAGLPVVISYTYRTLTLAHGHLLHFDIEQPTRGIDIELDYGDVPIAHVDMIDFIASSQKSRVAESPATVPGRSISVQFDGWAFPRSGVAFVWRLDSEVAVSDHAEVRKVSASA